MARCLLKAQYLAGNLDKYVSQADSTIVSRSIQAVSVTLSGSIATFKTAIDHSLSTGILVNINGANETEFNVTNATISVISSNEFSYSIIPGTNLTATGTIITSFNVANIVLTSVIAGSTGNIGSGGGLSLSSSVQGANQTGFVDFYGITGGTDIETDDAYRSRIDNKLFNNTQNYTQTGIVVYLLQKYSKITRVQILKNYVASCAIKSITKWPTDNNFRIIEFYAPHPFYSAGQVFYQITGSSHAQLNIQDGIVSQIINETHILCYFGNSTFEDIASSNMRLIPYNQGTATVMFLKDNDLNVYPTPQELQTVKSDITNNVMIWTDDDSTYYVASPKALTIKFAFSGITSNTANMRSAITANLVDYFKLYNNIGKKVKQREYESVILDSVDSAGNRLQDFNVTVTSGVIVGILDITPAIDEVADVNANNITFS